MSKSTESEKPKLFYEENFLFIKSALTLFAIWKYRKNVNEKQQQQQQQQQGQEQELIPPTLFTASLSNFKHRRAYIIISIIHAVSICTSYITSSALIEDPFFSFQMLLCYHVFHAVVFLVQKVSSTISSTSPSDDSVNVKNKPSFLIFQCFMTLVPIHTIYQVIILFLIKLGPSFSWIIHPPVTSIFDYQFFLIEIMITGKILQDTKEGTVQWPDFDDDGNHSSEKPHIGTIA